LSRPLEDRREAIEPLTRLTDACITTGRKGKQIEVLALKSVLLQKDEKSKLAQEHLRKALALAEPEGFLRVFIEHGPIMAEMLYKASKQGVLPEYANRLLASFSAPTKKETSEAKTQALVEPLKEREEEILQLIAEGLPDKDIAQKLHLAVSTVKWHNGNIYGKLGVTKRTEAVARARALGIL